MVKTKRKKLHFIVDTKITNYEVFASIRILKPIDSTQKCILKRTLFAMMTVLHKLKQTMSTKTNKKYGFIINS